MINKNDTKTIHIDRDLQEKLRLLSFAKRISLRKLIENHLLKLIKNENSH